MNIVKYLQTQGLGSRKTCISLIKNGLLFINGVLIENDKADIDPLSVQTIAVDGEAFLVIPQPYYIVLHKPAGFETSHKPRDYPSVFSLLPDQLRATDPQAVGRLDADTTGVLLISNDGQFNHRMTSPKHAVAKVYRVHLKHDADESYCATLLRGVLLHDENEVVRADVAELLDVRALLLTISQGKYHQVKRMCAAAGNRVLRLHRLRFGAWHVDDLREGEWRFVSWQENMA